MENSHSREEGLQRLTSASLSVTNQHYIGTWFIKNDIEQAVQQYANGHLLDIGCGNKPYEPIIHGKVTVYTGCDIVQSSERKVDVICPANQLSFDDEIFDTVFSTQVLEHVADYEGMVQEAHRVLKKGCYGIFTAPFSWELHEEPYDFFRFSKYGLRTLFEKKGFEVVTVKANGGKWAAISQLWLNVLFSTRKYNTFRSRVIKWLFVRFRLIVPYNKFSIWLDKKYFDDIFTLNYMVIVKKS